MMRVCSSAKKLDISLSLPARSTMAISSDPPPAITRSNPAEIESTATNTATTPAKPTTATAEEPSRCVRLLRLTTVTASVSRSHRILIAS